MKLTNKKCVPCEGLTDPLSIEEENIFLEKLEEWEINRENIHKIKKDFLFPHFTDSIKFVNSVANLSEEEGHHPNIMIFYNLVIIEIYTHAINGLSENDFILGSKIEKIFNTKHFEEKY